MRKLTLRMAILTALLPATAFSLGLGEIELKSALNQDLNAEIEVLSAEPQDAEQLIIKLASRDAFARAGIDRPFMLQQLKFKTIVKNGKPYIHAYSKKPIREPFLSFLLEIDWPEGHLIREYTVLLDPPVYAGSSTPAVDSGRPFIDPADQASQSQSVNHSVAPAASTATYASSAAVAHSSETPHAETHSEADTDQYDPDDPAVSNYQNQSASYTPTRDGSYRVQARDTLWQVANNLRPNSSITVEQMMIALVRENPESFIKENINGLKRGYILRIPDAGQITSIDRQQALAAVRQHTSLWREYRQARSGVVPASSIAVDEQIEVNDGDASTDTVDGELSIVSSVDNGSDQLGGSQDANSEIQRLRQQLAMAEEALESSELEKSKLSSRLSDLEKRVEGVLQMQDSGLAQLQDDLKAEESQAAVSTPIVDAETVAMTEPEVAENIISDVEPVLDVNAEAEIEAESESDSPSPAENNPEAAIFADELSSTDEATEDAAENIVEEETTEASDEAPEAPAFAQTTQPKTLLENILDDPKMLGAIGGAVVLVLGLVALLMRRRRVNKEEPSEDQAFSETADDFDSLGDIALANDTTSTMQTEAMDTVNPSDTSRMMVDADSDSVADLPDDPMLDEFDESILDDDKTNLMESIEDTESTAIMDHEETVISLDNEEESDEDDNRDDVIAEADVYLAYGIYQQAEELLKGAIEQNPERDDYRMKLLETHFASKNTDAFTALAEQVQARKGADRSYWDRVLVMGKELCPGEDLFSAEAPLLPDFDSDEIVPQKPSTPDFDLDAGSDIDLDLGVEEDDSGATQILSEPIDLDSLGGDTPTADDAELDLDTDLDNMLAEVDDGSTDEDIDLEFDLGDFEDDLESDETVLDKTELDIDEDFSLDFEASDLGLEADDSVAATDEANNTEIDDNEDDHTVLATDNLDLDSDLDLSDSETTDHAELEMEEGLDDLDIELPDDIEANLDVDLDDIDLDDSELADSETDDTRLNDTLITDSVELDEEDDDFDISELSEEIDEVSTKLDLARAYMDMGDSDGAISILQEVKQEGTDEQKQEAEALIAKAS